MSEPAHETITTTERRGQRRLNIRLPVEIRKESTGYRQLIRTVTRNISSGGVYLELDIAEYQPRDRLHLELTLPPAEGVSPYEGRAGCTAEVTRVQPVRNERTGAIDRFGVAARFLDRLRFSY
jgi:hypothetical protein